jgi:hypothetical protein
MFRFLVVTTLAALALACKPSEPGEGARASKIQPTEQEPEPEQGEASSTQQLRAAGVELAVPSDWTVLAEDEPNFALAYKAEQSAANIPVCTIELRRQGPGPLPEGARALSEGVFEYQRGTLRGRVRTLAGPQGASVVVHCRAPRSTQQWGAVTQMFESLVETGAAVELPPLRTNLSPQAIVELCVGTPARMTSVCARRADGAVYCGATVGTELTRVSLPSPAVEISCARDAGCARDAAGEVHCWRGFSSPEPVAELEGARELAQGVIVDRDGKLLRRGQAGFTTLAPFDDPALALTNVERTLDGSNPAWGCVLRNDELWCWDREHALPVRLASGPSLDGSPPQLVTAAAGASDLQRMGDRLCVKIGERWTCTDAAGERHELDGCETRACGCSLIGATRISCEHEPYERIDARPLGRVSNVVAIAEPCAALVDGTVVCRGPVAGQPGEQPGTTKSIASELPGIAHTLHLRD